MGEPSYWLGIAHYVVRLRTFVLREFVEEEEATIPLGNRYFLE